MSLTYFEDLVKLARQSLERPEYFIHHGNNEMFKTWGFAGIDKSRDSSILEKSNFDVITKELIKKYPNDFEIEGYSHWACGHIDRLICRVLKENYGPSENNITEAFKELIEWHKELNEYPIADDSEYYSLITEECIDIIENMDDHLLLMIDKSNDGWSEKIYHTLVSVLDFEFNPDYDQHPTDDIILEAVLLSSLCNQERWGEWYEWCDEKGLNRPVFENKENPNQLKLFEGW